MSETKTTGNIGTDWTKLLSDPDLVSHLGRLLQTYREAPADKREEALVAAMREIKSQTPAAKAAAAAAGPNAVPMPVIAAPVPTAAADTPPFEPDIFTPSWDRIAVAIRASSVSWPSSFEWKAQTLRSGATWPIPAWAGAL
jgi:hypothetical protein